MIDELFDPFRSRDITLKRYGGSPSALTVVLDGDVTRALGLKSEDHCWLRIAADNRSITVYLDNPNGNQEQAQSHAASKSDG